MNGPEQKEIMKKRIGGPIGFWHYAESYRSAAQTLIINFPHIPHGDAPIRYNYYHAIELYFKTFLVSCGFDDAGLRKLRHGFSTLLRVSDAHGMDLSGTFTEEIVTMIDAESNYIRERYIEIGPFTVPKFQFLDECSEILASRVWEELRAKAIHVRPFLKKLPSTSFISPF